MRRNLAIFILSSVTAFSVSAFSQWLWANKVMYYVSNGYDVPTALSFALWGPFVFLLGLGALVRQRTDFVAAWLGSTIFIFLGPVVVGSPRLGSLFEIVMGLLAASAVPAVALLIGRSLYWLGTRVAARRPTAVCS